MNPLSLFGIFSLLIQPAAAVPRPDHVFTALKRKTDQYIRDGLFVGGDRSIDGVVVNDIRRGAPQGNVERWVIDLTANRQGEVTAIPTAPYYQVSYSQDEQRVVVSIWGRPKLEFKAPDVVDRFKKSANFQSVELLPRFEEDSWTFSAVVKPGRTLEVFELANPVRIIMDVRSSLNSAVKSTTSKKH
jgi:hypothetical protein